MTKTTTKTTTTTKTQLRGVCPACFNQQAVRGGRMVQHGYTRPQQWHQNVGTCAGTGHAHFGSEKGRDFTAHLAQHLRDGALHDRALCVKVLNSVEGVPVLGRKRVAGSYTAYTTVVIENPLPHQRQAYAQQLSSAAEQRDAQAEEFERLVAEWVPRELVAVDVEPKRAPLVHFRGGYYSSHGRACAGSAMAAQRYALTTSDLADVTCEKCKQYVARRAAKAVNQ